MSAPPDVRHATTADAAEIAEIYRPYVVDGVASFETDPPDAAAIAARMTGEPRLPWLVADRGGQPVGYAYASPHRARAAYRWSVDVSVYLADAERGRGIGRLLYARLLPAVRDLGYVSAYAGIALPNPGSVALHERTGFEPVGVYRDVGFKHGRWHDVGWWQLRLVEPPPPRPAEPDPWRPAAPD